MKSLSQVILEVRGKAIDDQWLNDQKPVMTVDGRNVLITNIDLSEVPNVIHGIVKIKDKKTGKYKWTDDGICISARDMVGNPKRPDENDNLVKMM